MNAKGNIGLYIPGFGVDVQSQLVAVYDHSSSLIHPQGNHDLPQGAKPRWSIDTIASSDGAFG